MRKKSKLPIILLVLFLILGTNAGNYWYFNIYSTNIYKEDAESKGEVIEQNTRTYYVAEGSISAGEIITEERVTETVGLVENPLGLFTKDDIGTTAIAYIAAGTTLYEPMTYNPSNILGNISEYTTLYLPKTLAEGNLVDVRIRFPNGGDYIVTSKVKVSSLDTDTNKCLLYLSERERQFMSSAMYDCGLYSAEMYVTIYAAPETQIKSDVMYIPNKVVINSVFEGVELQNMKLLRQEFENSLLNVVDAPLADDTEYREPSVIEE